jgi:sulfide:quinone oxidoreductase
MCYLEYGHHEVARVDVVFVSGQRPTGTFEPPSVALAAEKEELGKTRIRRWFGREWAAVAH